MEATRTGFGTLLKEAQKRNNSLLCVGLDPDVNRFPDNFRNGSIANPIVQFNRAIIEATSDLASCYKPNLGFYLPYGQAGLEALADLRAAVPDHIPVLLDAKVGDIDTTTAAYARAYFDEWQFDAVTANPFMGHDSIAPLLQYKERGVFILAKTSNHGSGFIQDQMLRDGDQAVSHYVARMANEWNAAGNVGLVVGATYPEQLGDIRSIAPDLPILVPGVGAQEGELEASLRAGLDTAGGGLLVNASRAISYASSDVDFQDAARAAATAIRDTINQVRQST